MRKIVCDANAMIYLTKSGLLKSLTEAANLILPKAVVHECLDHASLHHEDADFIKELLEKGNIQAVSYDINSQNSYPKFGTGEEAVLSLFEHLHADMILTDDGEVVKYCRHNKIPFLSSPFVPALLYDKGLIPLSQGLRGVLTLSKIGYFSEEVIHSSLKELLKSKRLRGVLFDLDGVLVDTMRLHDRAWREAILPLGLKISDEEIYLREGEKGTVTAHDLLLKAKKEPTSESIGFLLKEKERYFKQNSTIELFPKALTCLELFNKRGYLLGLVTGTSLGEVKVFLEEGFLNLFKTIVTGDRVTLGKPHPEPYLSAIDKMGLKPEETLVIENAPYGIRSAKSAQLACIALATSLPQSYLSDADLILSGLDELLRLFINEKYDVGEPNEL